MNVTIEEIGEKIHVLCTLDNQTYCGQFFTKKEFADYRRILKRFPVYIYGKLVEG